jgi:hypothetical protein
MLTKEYATCWLADRKMRLNDELVHLMSACPGKDMSQLNECCFREDPSRLSELTTCKIFDSVYLNSTALAHALHSCNYFHHVLYSAYGCYHPLKPLLIIG